MEPTADFPSVEYYAQLTENLEECAYLEIHARLQLASKPWAHLEEMLEHYEFSLMRHQSIALGKLRTALSLLREITYGEALRSKESVW